MPNKSSIIISVVFLALVLWLNHVYQFIAPEKPKDRITTSTEIANIINHLQDTLTEPQVLLEQFIELSQLSETEQRGTWELLALIDIDFDDEIDDARDNIKDIAGADDPELITLKNHALDLVTAYEAYPPAYERIVSQLKTDNLSPNEIDSLLATEMNIISEATATAANAFMLAQEAILRAY